MNNNTLNSIIEKIDRIINFYDPSQHRDEQGRWDASGATSSPQKYDDFVKKYKENETNNYHTENVAMLVNRYGDNAEKAIANSLAHLHNRIGYKHPLLASAIDALNNKYLPKAHAEKANIAEKKLPNKY